MVTEVSSPSQPASQPASPPASPPASQPASPPARQPASPPASQPARQPASPPARQPASPPARFGDRPSGRDSFSVAHLLVHHQFPVQLRCELDEFAGGVTVDRERFLGEDMLSGAQRAARDLGLSLRHHGDVEHLDLVVFEQFVDAGHARHVELVGDLLREVLAEIADRRDGQSGLAVRRQVSNLDDRSGADQDLPVVGGRNGELAGGRDGDEHVEHGGLLDFLSGLGGEPLPHWTTA
jgi:hypothetical protein